MMHTLPSLPYSYDAMEPHIDAQTMQLHHEKHHQNAVDNLNKSIAGTDGEHKPLNELLANISAYPAAVRNAAGGHHNHTMFWKTLGNNGSRPTGELETAINDTYGSLDGLKEKMNAAAATHFGSGWAWLSVKDGKLVISATPNQDNPRMDVAETMATPILGIDVWEHAYYLKHQNKRADYLNAIWNVINWNVIGERYEAVMMAG